MTILAERPIGIFDSGVGGLTVVRAVLELLPNERLVYLGDTARVPYGGRSLETIVRYSRDDAQFLLRHQVKMVMIACNTATAAALPTLEKELSVPVLGAVAPGAMAAVHATKVGVVGVIATSATIRSLVYPAAIYAQSPSIKVFGLPCPMLAPMIEEGWLSIDDPLPLQIIRRYLKELYHQSKQIDTLVLACTHYPLIGALIEKVATELWDHPVTLVDSASTMALAAKEKLADMGQLNTQPVDGFENDPLARLQCYVTDEARVFEIGSRFLGGPLHGIQLVQL